MPPGSIMQMLNPSAAILKLADPKQQRDALILLEPSENPCICGNVKHQILTKL